MTEPIPISRLLLGFIPTALLLVLLLRRRGEFRTSLIGLARMLTQLAAVGYLLVLLFEQPHPAWTLGVVTLMLGFASAIAIRTTRRDRWRRLVQAALAIGLAGGGTLVVMTFLVLHVDPWYSPRVVIPLAGMTLSSCMNAISLAAERFDSERQRGGDVTTASDVALSTAMIPVINSLMAVGVVSIPGMMTGQVLAGVSPLIAARYQVMIMAMLFASAGLSVHLWLWMQRRD